MKMANKFAPYPSIGIIPPLLQTSIIVSMLYFGATASFLADKDATGALKYTIAAVILLFFLTFEILIKSFNLSGMGGERADLFFSYGENATYKDAFSFWVGFGLLAVLVSGASKSILGFSVFSASAQAIDYNTGIYLVTQAAPVAEEAFFLIAFPVMLFYTIKGLAKAFKLIWKPLGELLDSRFTYAILTALIVGVSFAVFHIGQQTLISFIWAAIVFRAMLIIFADFDLLYDIVPSISTVYAFAVGAHMANNINATIGFQQFFTTFLWNNNWGYLTTAILSTITLLAIIGVKTGRAFARR